MKTYTPTLDATTLDQLREYATVFAEDFPQAKPAQWAEVYLQGLLLDGERKSITTLAPGPTPRGLGLQGSRAGPPAIRQSEPLGPARGPEAVPGSPGSNVRQPRGLFLFDDVSFPKQGTHSVGVQRQYCGTLGKKANCQVAVSVHYVSPKGHYPLDLQLYLPDSWLTDTKRLDKAGVPKDHRRPRTKHQIALALLDRVRAEGLPGRAVVADAGYGVSGDFRDGLEQRGLSYIVGVTGDLVAFTEEPAWDRPTPSERGRPRTRPRLAVSNPHPVTLSVLAGQTPRRRVS